MSLCMALSNVNKPIRIKNFLERNLSKIVIIFLSNTLLVKSAKSKSRDIRQGGIRQGEVIYAKVRFLPVNL